MTWLESGWQNTLVSSTGAIVWLRARSAGGDITVRGGAEDLVSASVSGAVTVTGGPVRAARLETMTGNIVFVLLPPPLVPPPGV